MPPHTLSRKLTTSNSAITFMARPTPASRPQSPTSRVRRNSTHTVRSHPPEQCCAAPLLPVSCYAIAVLRPCCACISHSLSLPTLSVRRFHGEQQPLAAKTYCDTTKKLQWDYKKLYMTQSKTSNSGHEFGSSGD